MINKNVGVESALYYILRFPNLKSIYNNIWQKRPLRIGYLLTIRFLCQFFVVVVFCFIYLFFTIYALELAIAKVQRTILRQLVAFESVLLHDVAATLFVLFPKAIDLPKSKPSKPLVLLVPITCTTYCFQEQGHSYVTIPIVFPANHKPCLKQLQDNPPKQ